ncbi:cAMP-binding domain of CRP or a regulatory subunit of cAMP-dependent protein kinases [Flagellimonas taeanensis]|uniref:cAMP-binding domain of CRP or a regulatory subunit of cAMP-dependent protein kinases n=1 Tax=Flagellimonas taeanensis TaxID=1005926 RepID=A0A1M6UU30_9FLAO|nr:Crp/Fnr family transcriptional regulator [Allomuricauda taeanensis]SFC23488.1 cAMP-binding domain of CRP or a regulatory subunit of cAMP-dependent protein kinases [Allomuricauda taeanensis]SHK72739.1 cAMP-binding domain of CRP or a regulatory subunit of cAMP-dependent protein kinases [Allomuricauda taeanensis]
MIDLDQIKRIYSIAGDLNFSDVKHLLQAAGRKTFLPGEHLIEADTLQNQVYFIYKGLVRVYAVNERGDEITTELRCENELVASYDVIFFDKPSRFYIQAMEKTETFHIAYDELQKVLERNRKLDVNRKYILQNLLKNAFERIDTFTLKTPEERYLHFLESNPSLTNRVPDKYIANVLGVTPVSLSRIRKRIAQKTKS